MPKASGKKARVVSSRVSYRGPVFWVTTDDVLEPTGIRARRDVVRHSGSVVVLAVDESVGALLIEAVEPGTPLVESAAYPKLESLVALLTSLHGDGVPDPLYRPVADHIAYLFDSGMKNYERRPDLAELIPPELYARGRESA